MATQPGNMGGPGPNGQPMPGEELISEDEARKRREQLNRRPSYRMILKDLETADKVLKKEPEETPPSSVDASPLQRMDSSQSLASLQVHIPHSQPVRMPSGPSPYTSPIQGGGLLPPQAHSLQLNGVGDLSSQLPPQLDLAAAFAAATATSSHAGQQQSAGNSQQAGGSSLGGMSMSSDNHVLKPIPGMDPSNFQDWHSPLISNSGYSSSPSPTMPGGSRGMGGEDESSRKRQAKLQVRLLKNREAAKECRRKKKEYVKCLENRVAVLENQNKALIEELKTLKELYCRKEKNDM